MHSSRRRLGMWRRPPPLQFPSHTSISAKNHAPPRSRPRQTWTAPPPATTNRARLPSHYFADPLLQGLPTSSITDSALRWPWLRAVRLLQMIYAGAS
uniref:Uncharacterized protein n=1 Tax=Arundo donax TaxID=35708 RepID=A0A0A9G6P7_ARUDO